MYTLGSASGLSGRSLFQYTLSIPFDVSTASVSSDDHITVGGSWTTDNEAMRFNNDGTKLFVLFDSPNQNTSSYMYQYTLSTPYDITSTVTAGNSLRLGNQYKNYRTFLFNDDGSEMFISETGSIYKYTLSTSFDTSTASATSSYLSEGAVTGMQYNNDGTKLFTVYQTTTIGSTAKIIQWSLSTAYDPTTASSDMSTYFDTGETVIADGRVPTQFITFNNDGSKFFSFNHTNGTVNGGLAKIKEWNLASPFNLTNDVSGEHSGDVINTSSTANYDTDPDSDTLTVTAIRTGSSEGSGTVGSVGSALTGTYGQLTIAANGSYTYVANQDAADALDPGDVVTDTFNYTVSDGQGETDMAVLTITVNGINDTPVADAETGSVDISQTLTVTDGTSDLLHGDTDADASASLSVSSIVATTASGSATAVNPGTAYNSGYTSVTGSKGTLRVGADGTYQYIADSSTGTDVFTYTLSDGTATHTATLTITVNSGNSVPTASNSTVYINENNQASSAGDRTPSNITKIFAASDFNYSDGDSDSLSKIKITTLESAGTLEYSDGSSWSDVTENQEITASDIGNNRLRFTPAANSESNPTFGFKVHDGTEYSSSAYTMTISVNAAPDADDIAGGSVAADAASSGDVHDGVADSDDDDSVLVVTGVASGNESSNNSIVTDNTGVGSAVSGTYGSLNIAANGTYTYTASETNNIAYGATATDTFTFTTRDDESNSGSNAYDVGTITFTVASSISLVADTDAVAEDGTVTHLTNSEGTVISNDAADTNGLVVTHIKKDGGSNSTVAGSSTYNNNGTSITGTYGTLVIGADGTYTYTADQDAADDLDLNDEVTDVFVYTADGDTANLTFTVTGINDVPEAADKTVTTNEDTAYVFSTSDFGYTDADDDDALVSVKITGLEDKGALEYYNGTAWVDVTANQVITATDIAANKLRFNPAANENGSSYTSFDFTVNDGDADSASANTITVNVTAVNDAPVAVADTDTVKLTETVTNTTNGAGTVISDDTDVDTSSSLSVTSITATTASGNAQTTFSSNTETVTGSYGALTINSNGSYSYVAGSSAGTDVFTYIVSDGSLTSSTTLTFTVTLGDPPVAVNDTDVVDEDATVTQSSGNSLLVADDTDADGNTLTVTQIAVTGSSNNAVTANSTYNSGSPETVTGTYGQLTVGADGSYTYVANQSVADDLDLNDEVTDSFTYTVSDGANTDTATLIFTVTGVNDLPTASNNTITTNEDTNHVFSTSEFNFSDVDDSGSLNKIKITSLENDGALQYYNGTAWVDVTLNQEITATDIANNKLRFKPDANENGSSYTSFAFQVSDGTAYSSSSYTMTVNVTAVNDAPTATNDNGSVNEDSTLTVSTASSGVTQNNDTDPDADDTASTLVVNQITPSGGSASSVSSGTTYSNGTSVTGTYGTLTIGANGTYTYVANQTVADDLDAGDKATDVFTYRITDTTGATSTADITITVTGINDVPTASDKTVSTTEDTPYVFSTSDFGYTDADDDDALVSIKITELEDAGALQYYNGSTWVDVTLNQVITVSDITSGYLRLNPDANENGSPYTTIKFTVNDGDADSATPNTITVNVTAVNDAPSAVNDAASVDEDGTTTVSNASNGVIDNNDTDPDSLDTLTITNITHTNGNAESVTASTTYSNGQSIVGTYGTLTIGANGTYTYVADQDATDALDVSDEVDDVFTYTVSDGNGGTDTASITVRVTGVNDTPTSTGGTITTNEDENYILTVNDFNFSDPDDSGSLNKVKITTLETNGNLEYYNGTAWVAVTENQEITASDITSGYLRFRPDANENGSSYTTFGYQVSDGTVYSSATTMTVNVTAVNDAPVATDDASSVTEDSIVRVRANGDDLLNDDSDTESDSLSVTLIKPLNGSNTTISSGSSTTITGTYGELTVNSNGSYTYRANQDAADTLDTGENAEEQFVYTVSDGNGGTDTGILTITINGVEDNPNAVKDNVSLNISQSLTLTGNAITNDIDPDDSLTIVGCGQGRNPDNGTAKTVGTAFDSNYGQMTINADGSYTFIAVSNIKDLLDPGQSVTERFYYTISDGNSTSTAMIEVTVQRDNVLQELTKKEQKQIKKQIAKDRLNEPSTIRLPNKTTPAKTIEQTADVLESISSAKKLSFNEGIKLVDLVAETGSLTTTEGSLDKVKAKEKDGQLNLKFKVSTDLGNQVVKYEGVMPDGSKLPDWIKVDPQTGKTTTNIPEGVEQVDFTIIAIDQQNNKKEIAVSIDPKEIKADKSIFKQAKKQNASLSVDQSGNVNIVKTNESGDVNQTETKNLNANEKQNTSNNIITQDLNLDNTNDIKNIIDTIKSDQVYQLQTINNGEALEIKVPETLLGNFEKTKLVLKDGSAIPDWVEFDPITGEINANPPEDVNKLEFKLIIERDGEIIVKDLAVDIGSDDNAQILDDIENTKFIAFKDQLNKEHDNWEDYGSNIINRL
jgi:VCBS repeat-containing protein